MPHIKPHLIIDIESADLEKALEEWRWLIGLDAKPLYVTAAGDVILIYDSGHVALLDTGGGYVEVIARSVDAFEQGLSDPENLADWFAASVVEQLHKQNMYLGPGQCYGYTTLPVFAEGSYGPENRFVLSVKEHLAFTADVHKQIMHMPEGSKIRIKVKQ